MGSTLSISTFLRMLRNLTTMGLPKTNSRWQFSNDNTALPYFSTLPKMINLSVVTPTKFSLLFCLIFWDICFGNFWEKPRSQSCHFPTGPHLVRGLPSPFFSLCFTECTHTMQFPTPTSPHGSIRYKKKRKVLLFAKSCFVWQWLYSVP